MKTYYHGEEQNFVLKRIFYCTFDYFTDNYTKSILIFNRISYSRASQSIQFMILQIEQISKLAKNNWANTLQ